MGVARVAQLMEAWRVLATARDQASWRGSESDIRGLATAMKIIDAVIALEEGAFAPPDDQARGVGYVDMRRGLGSDLAAARAALAPAELRAIAEQDRLLLSRLREVVAIRDVFGERQREESEAAE